MIRKYGFLVFVLSQVMAVACYAQVRTAAERTEAYLPVLRGKRVGLVANHTSMVGDRHLVDVFREEGIALCRIFTPEHGFRGNHADGAVVHEKDEVTGIPVVSLYGERRKPRAGDLEGLDVVVYDLQDVGVRCYTYLSTMHHVMEACAENGVELMVLDRPNPNGYFVDGPILEPAYRSFVGMHPIPFVHGMTLGELARMINGEGWLGGGLQCSLTVIPCENYTHRTFYELPVPPSPNLPNMKAVYLYPSLVLFEGTVVSVGRGTDFPFQVFGHPAFKGNPLEFTPVAVPGVSDRPPLEGETCYGVDLREVPDDFLHDQAGIVLDWLLAAREEYGDDTTFFTPYFDRLAGTAELRTMIMEGKDKYQIRYAWKRDLNAFRERRKPYLLYPE
ncbi:MAG TPA: DUF1343 domain-containing protein [Bacteroidetes bacterium]|nr:DUF1343 domain-containing protein [Bacteroidota bacterium]